MSIRAIQQVDAVVNSAGLLQNPVRLADLDMAEFDHIHAVNVRGTLLVNRSFSTRNGGARHRAPSSISAR